MSEELFSRTLDVLERHHYGKYRGLVVDNADPEQLGRLKVRVPSVLRDAVTDWASPCVPYGGLPEQGWFFIPDVGAGVWVEFEEGNLDLPIWVGTFWSKAGGSSTVPTQAKAMDANDPKRRVLKTSSAHFVEMCDVAGKEAVRIVHKGGASITMNEKGSIVLGNANGSLIYLNAEDGEVTIVDEHGNNIKLGDSGATITNKDGSLVDIAGGDVQVVAKNVHIRSQTVSLGEGAMEPAILGTTFAALFDAHIHPTALGPSGPPIPAPMPLSVPTNPAISKVVKVK